MATKLQSIMTFKQQFKAAILRMMNPGYSHCKCCGMPWNYVESKSVWVSERDGVFATCIDCWNKLPLDELKKYYTQVYHNWRDPTTGIVPVPYSLEHLLTCVETEYNETHLPAPPLNGPDLPGIGGNSFKITFSNDWWMGNNTHNHE